jgi:dolichol-phosphate mannosyltransferase
VTAPVVPRRLFVQLATYCELDNLRTLVPELLALDGGFHVLVVDDSSPDGTPQWLAETALPGGRLHHLVRPRKLGYASATIDGFHRAAELGADVVVTMDADFSHDPQQVPELVARLAEADVVLGSRYVGGCRVLDWALHRLLVSVFANGYVRTILRLPWADATSGFRAYRVRTLLEAVHRGALASGGYAVLVELLYRLHHQGARIVEHPIVYSERREGQSKMSKRVMVEAAFMPFLLWLRVGLPRRRRGAGRPRDVAAAAVDPDGGG